MDVDITIGFPGLLDVLGNLLGRDRRRRARQVSFPGVAARIAPARQIPVPQAPIPEPTPQPFPRRPAANDPVFRRGAGRILSGLGGVLGGIVLSGTIEAVLRRIEENERRRRQREQEAEEQIERRRRGRDAPLPEIVFEPIPEIVIGPQRQTAPSRPVPADFPATPRRSPDPAPRRGPAAVPVILPGQTPVPRIPTPTAPAPRTSPTTLPSVIPAFLPFSAPVPQAFPVGSPAPSPANLPQPAAAGLTGFNVGTVQFPSTAPQAQPQTDPQRKCEEVKRRRRRKGKCREGYFVEEAGKTKYTTWRTRDCATGEIVRDTKRRRDRLIRDSKNVIDLFGGL